MSWRKNRVRLIDMLTLAASSLFTLFIAARLIHDIQEIYMPTWLLFAIFTGFISTYAVMLWVFMQLISAVFIKAV